MEESMQSNEREIRIGAGLVEGGVNVFLLPCKIDLDGSAPFSKYFNIKEIDEGEDRDTGGKKAITASFRGRKLLGEKYILPSNTHGAIVTELSSGGKQSLEVKETFNEFHVFAHDEMPTVNPVASGLGWLDVCGAIHDPHTSSEQVKADNDDET